MSEPRFSALWNGHVGSPGGVKGKHPASPSPYRASVCGSLVSCVFADIQQKRRGSQPYVPRQGLCPRAPFTEGRAPSRRREGPAQHPGPVPALPPSSAASLPRASASSSVIGAKKERGVGKREGGKEQKEREEEDGEDAEWAQKVPRAGVRVCVLVCLAQ